MSLPSFESVLFKVSRSICVLSTSPNFLFFVLTLCVSLLKYLSLSLSVSAFECLIICVSVPFHSDRYPIHCQSPITRFCISLRIRAPYALCALCPSEFCWCSVPCRGRAQRMNERKGERRGALSRGADIDTRSRRRGSVVPLLGILQT